MVDRDAVRRGYDALAETYAALRAEEGDGRDVLRGFLDPLPESARILDAGCGQGTPVLRDLNASATGIGMDVSRTQLSLAAERVPGAPLVQGDMTDLPLRRGSVDAITAYHSLIHVPREDHQDAVDEFARVLRPDGRLLLSEGLHEWSGTNPDWLDAGVGMQWHIAGVEATRSHLANAGFVVEDEWRVDDSLEDDTEGRWAFLSARLAE